MNLLAPYVLRSSCSDAASAARVIVFVNSSLGLNRVRSRVRGYGTAQGVADAAREVNADGIRVVSVIQGEPRPRYKSDPRTGRKPYARRAPPAGDVLLR